MSPCQLRHADAMLLAVAAASPCRQRYFIDAAMPLLTLAMLATPPD